MLFKWNNTSKHIWCMFKYLCCEFEKSIEMQIFCFLCLSSHSMMFFYLLFLYFCSFECRMSCNCNNGSYELLLFWWIFTDIITHNIKGNERVNKSYTKIQSMRWKEKLALSHFFKLIWIYTIDECILSLIVFSYSNLLLN
jgi:hypothetical protein